MTTFPLMDCCELLAIDPKTLRYWLRQANMSLSIHPTDARIKCLTHEQVQCLATLHGRALKSHELPASASLGETSPLETPQEPSHPQILKRATLMKSASTVVLQEGDLTQKLFALEAHVAVLQQQLVLLTQELLRERDLPMDPSLLSLDPSAQRAAERDLSQQESQITKGHAPQGLGRRLHSAEQRALSLVLPPLIEYGAADSYVVISSQEGELHLIADSPQWFEWFRTLSSFRFVGQSGRFGACRGYDRRPTRMWYAHRTIHQHNYRHYLGLSEHLTIAHLEQMAAKLQAHMQ